MGQEIDFKEDAKTQTFTIGVKKKLKSPKELEKEDMKNYKKAGIANECNKEKIGQILKEKNKKIIDGLIVARGTDKPKASQMKTVGLHTVLEKKTIYKITPKGLEAVDQSKLTKEEKKKIKYLGLRRKRKRTLGNVVKTKDGKEKLPSSFMVIEAKWDKETVIAGGNNNALGDNGVFDCYSEDMVIPRVDANQSDLDYYGGAVLEFGDLVDFGIETRFPIWNLRIGKNYVKEFVLPGSGLFVEYHNDFPHFHMPLSPSGGYYLLGKYVKQDKDGYGIFNFTGFNIPYGKAVYTDPGTIHCDSYLIGDKWLIGYMASHQFSTVLLRSHAHKVELKSRGVQRKNCISGFGGDIAKNIKKSQKKEKLIKIEKKEDDEKCLIRLTVKRIRKKLHHNSNNNQKKH